MAVSGPYVHTPHESTALSQHRPDGGSGVEQHTPWMSIATALPPHTPHASIARSQHRPELSVVTADVELDDTQHWPVTASMGPLQHTPNASVTPDTHVALAALVDTTMLQSTPPHPSPHTHSLPRHTMFF
jgi:hypothetical protein